MPDDTRHFYDDLAEDYHLIFHDWDASLRWQAKILSALLGPPPLRVLDIACGMGTQTLGLALSGYEVVGRDLSPGLIRRAQEEAARRGIEIDLCVGDMREARPADQGRYDAVIAFDNALPHLEHEEDLLAALSAARKALCPGGLFCASLRDYDTLARERPRLDPARLLGEGARERVVLQLWHWDEDGRGYELEHILLARGARGDWVARVRRGRYRALRRAELEAVAAAAGFLDARWLSPEDTGFYQPVFLARSPRALSGG